MREKLIERKLRESIEALGGEALKFTSPGQRGVPDRIVILPKGRIWFVELKAPGKKPDPLQLEQHRRLRELGCTVEVLDTPETVTAFVQRIGGDAR